MIQPHQRFITGTILLLLISTTSIPSPAAIQTRFLKRTGSQPPVIESSIRFRSLPEVKFQTYSDQCTTYFTSTGMILTGFSLSPIVKGTPQYFELQIFLRNALPNVEITTLNPRLARSDFFGSKSPSWLTNIPNYAKVKYTNLYPDVDMLLQIQEQQLDFDFVIAPGGDPKSIRFLVQGAQKVRLTPEGTLLLNVHDVTFELPKPQGYQAFDSSTGRSVVDARYMLIAKNEIGLQIAPYNTHRTLIIDR